MGEFLPRQQAAHLLKNMKVIAAYMLAVVGGNDKPDVASVKKILSSVGIELEGDSAKQLEDLVEEMASKDMAEILKAGLEKLKSVPGGGAAAPGAAAAVEEEEEEEEEIPAAGGLFDDV